MKYIADLHIHSPFSRATSKQLIPENLDYWSKLKGINVMGTGDCSHPGWLKELKEKLVQTENGFLHLKPELVLPHETPILSNKKTQFMLTAEISCIYRKKDKVRKVHNLCILPNFKAADLFHEKLKAIGNVHSDGRPILGLDSKHLLEMLLEIDEQAYLIPAHIWTPWFSVLGSKSGFDSIEECFEDLTPHIFAVETGLSSDPPMNRICSFLDKFRLVSNSDAHSPEKLAREANLFDTELSYSGMFNALKNDDGFLGTIEFFAQEGKYHYDGHRKCDIVWTPTETLKHNGICPVCNKPVTKGVMYRVAELADRDLKDNPLTKQNFYSITQLQHLLAEIHGTKSTNTKKVKADYFKHISTFGSELNLLLTIPIAQIEAEGTALLAEGIKRLREGTVHVKEGYDGEFGRINVFSPEEINEFSAGSLFQLSGIDTSRKPKKIDSIEFDVSEFQHLQNKQCSDKNNIIETKSITEDAPIHIDPQIQTAAETILDEPPQKKETTINQASPERSFELPLFTPSPKNETESKQKTDINPQIKAIQFHKGICIVLAGPGAGKTYVLTKRISHLIQNNGVTPNHILALTFSNKAAEEMKNRILNDLSIVSLKIEKTLSVSTFHAFGLKILEKGHALCNRKEGFRLIDPEEQIDIIKMLSTKNKRDTKKISAKISQHKQQDLPLTTKEQTLFNQYEKTLIELNAFDLDDLIYWPNKILDKEPNLKFDLHKKYQWILIDEYQDINQTQYQLIKHLINPSSPNLFVIGDPNQAIYGFRGSDVGLIDQLYKDHANITTIKLNKSYRCPQNILTIAGQALQQDNTLIAIQTENISINSQECITEKSEAEFIGAQIEKMIGGTQSFSIDSGMSDGTTYDDIHSLSDIAILCRTSLMFNPLIKACQNHGIPYQTIGSKPFYLEKPYHDIIKALQNSFYNINPDTTILDAFNKDLPLHQLIVPLLTTHKVQKEGQNRLIHFLKQYQSDYHRFFNDIGLRLASDDYNPQIEAVSIMTIHAAKGLEFTAVFIPGCEEGILPFELFGKKTTDEINEEERLFYVGVTRSKKYLTLTHSKNRFIKGKKRMQVKSPILNRLEQSLLNIQKQETTQKKQLELQMGLF